MLVGLYMQNKRMDPIRRLTAPTVEVLRVLLDASGPVWGLRVAKLTGRAPGSVYPILSRLEESDWVRAEWESDEDRAGPRRRLYSLTEDGAQRASQTVAGWDARAVRPTLRPLGVVEA